MQNILITGANGFVGSNLYDHLSGDFHLLGIDITREGKYSDGDNFGWDELETLPPVDAIVHLAGKAHDTSNTSAEQEYFDVNLGLTERIFDYFLQSGAGKFIFFSSVKAVADTVEGEILTEDVEPKPMTAYGRSKLAAERYIKLQASSHKPQAIRPTANCQLPAKEIYILRPAMIHGPGNKGNLNLLYQVVRKGIPWPLGAFDNRRSFASIGNVAFVVRRLIEQPVAPGTYNLADDEPVSTNDLIQMMAQSMDRKEKILSMPVPMIRSIARMGDLLHLPLNSERLKKLTESYVVSNDKLKSALGIQRMPVSATEGLGQTLSSFKTAGK